MVWGEGMVVAGYTYIAFHPNEYTTPYRHESVLSTLHSPCFSQGTCYILVCNLEWRPIPLIINPFTFFTLPLCLLWSSGTKIRQKIISASRKAKNFNISLFYPLKMDILSNNINYFYYRFRYCLQKVICLF